MKVFEKNFVRFLSGSFIVFVISILWYFFAADDLVNIWVPFMVPFLFLVNLFFYTLQKRLSRKNEKKTLIFHLAFSGIKLFIYLTVLILVGVLFKNGIVVFYINFLVFYLVFAFMDVKFLAKAN